MPVLASAPRYVGTLKRSGNAQLGQQLPTRVSTLRTGNAARADVTPFVVDAGGCVSACHSAGLTRRQARLEQGHDEVDASSAVTGENPSRGDAHICAVEARPHVGNQVI
jgi:hypothetical protein